MNLFGEDPVGRCAGASNFRLEPWDRRAHDPGDAKPKYRLRSDLQGAVGATDSCGLLLRLAPALRRAPALSAGGECLGVDPKLGLPCGGRGRYAGPTCETAPGQAASRRRVGPTAGVVAD